MLPKLLNFRLRKGSLVAFTGLMGSGKTGLMSVLAARQTIGVDARRCAANYDTVFADRIRTFDELDARNTAFCLDEYQLTIGARQFAAKTNLDVSEWMELRIRKRDNVLLFTTQDLMMVDINARRLLALWYRCEYVLSRGVDYTLCQVFKNVGGDAFVLSGKFVVPQSVYYGLYNHEDEDVKLVSASASNKSDSSGPREPARKNGAVTSGSPPSSLW